MYYYGARYYDPETSIWLSVDPLAMIYPNMNPYNYVMNNPINHIDPTGMFCVDADGNKTPCPEGEMYDDYRNNPDKHVEILPEVEIEAKTDQTRECANNVDFGYIEPWRLWRYVEDWSKQGLPISATNRRYISNFKVNNEGTFLMYTAESLTIGELLGNSKASLVAGSTISYFYNGRVEDSYSYIVADETVWYGKYSMNMFNKKIVWVQTDSVIVKKNVVIGSFYQERIISNSTGEIILQQVHTVSPIPIYPGTPTPGMIIH